MPRPAAVELTDLIITAIETERVTALFDVVLDLWETGQGLTGVLEYNIDLFDAPDDRPDGGPFPELACSDCSRSGAAHLRLVYSHRDRAASVAGGMEQHPGRFPVHESLHQLFEEQVEAAPTVSLPSIRTAKITYAELNREGESNRSVAAPDWRRAQRFRRHPA